MGLDEQKTTGVSYLFQFYSEVQSLNHWFSLYINLILAFEKKYKDIENLDESDKSLLNNHVAEVRHACNKSYIMYKSLIIAIKEAKEDKSISSAYDSIRKDYVIKREDIEKFAIGLNAFLAGNAMQSLLISNQKLMEGIFQS